jgi:hypothetical protein
MKRIEAKRQRRLNPSKLTKRAQKRRCEMHANRMTRIYAMDAGDVPAGEVN